jgi:hypothetical protein
VRFRLPLAILWRTGNMAAISGGAISSANMSPIADGLKKAQSL